MTAIEQLPYLITLFQAARAIEPPREHLGLAPLVLAALISGGAAFAGNAIGGIGAGIGSRNRNIGSAQHAAKLDDIGKQFMNYQSNPQVQQLISNMRSSQFGGRVSAPKIGSIDQLEVDPLGGYGDLAELQFGNQAQALSALAGSVQGGGDSTGLRASINRELAASGRSAQGMLGASGALRSGATSDFLGNMQGGALAQLAQALNQDELQRAQLAGGFLGQSGQLNLGQQGMQLERGTENRRFEFGVDASNRDAEMAANQFNITNDFNRQLNNANFGLEAERLTQGRQSMGLQSQQAALDALLAQEAMGLQSRQTAAQIYQNDAFSSPRYDQRTGQVKRGK